MATLPDDPDPLTEAETVLLWREDMLVRAGYPPKDATRIAASTADLHQAVALIQAGCSIHTALEILT